MTHWSGSGISVAERDHDDSIAMLWGDPAATMIEAGVQRLIARLDTTRHRSPNRGRDRRTVRITNPPA